MTEPGKVFIDLGTYNGDTIALALKHIPAYRKCMGSSRMAVGKSVDEVLKSFEVNGDADPPAKRIPCDNGPEFISVAIGHRLAKLGVNVLYIEPASPWQNVL